jgi:hypothetical protein
VGQPNVSFYGTSIDDAIRGRSPKNKQPKSGSKAIRYIIYKFFFFFLFALFSPAEETLLCGALISSQARERVRKAQINSLCNIFSSATSLAHLFVGEGK